MSSIPLLRPDRTALQERSSVVTCDTLFRGRLTVYQPQKGYRFALDAVLLAGLTKVRFRDRIADLGTGCGVVPLILAYRGLGKQIVGLEIQPELVEVAHKNILVNGFSDRITVREGDLREISKDFRAGSCDLVVSNPPYRRLHCGRLNPDGQRAVARHEVKSSVVDVCKAASYLLHDGGRLSVIYPATRLAFLLAAAQASGLSPKWLTVIYSSAASEARLVCLECRKGAGEELRIMPPFVIYRADGTYTEAMCLLSEGEFEENQA